MRFFLPALAVISTLPLHAADWPQYRGPSGDGKSAEKFTMPAGGVTPKQVWKVESDGGFGSFAVSGGRAFTLTDLMASDPNTITSTLARMEKSRLITRTPHEQDKRANRVKIQPAGRRTFEKARKIAMDLQESVLSRLPSARRTKFLEELESIADSCAAELEKPSRRRALEKD